VTWDDTKYVQGYPGSWVVLARRKGNDWYAAGIAGDTARNMTVLLSFLSNSPATYQMTLITDGATATTFSESMDTVGSGDSIKINTPLRGGWVAKFLNIIPPVAAPEVSHVKPGFDAVSRNFIVASGSFTLPAGYAGKKVLISFFSPNGGLLKSAVIEKHSIDLKRDFSLPSGVFVVRAAIQ
jgi:hypothetical protein